MLQRLGFAVRHGLERVDLVGVGALPGRARTFLADSWWGRDIDLGMISGRQDPDVNARFLENNRPRKREKWSVGPLAGGSLVEGIDESLEARNATP